VKQIITVILFFISGLAIHCQEPSGDLLTGVAGKFISKFFPEALHEIISIRPVMNDTVITMYVVELKPEGWILMSADQRVQPVLGFSFSGNYILTEKDPKNPNYLWINQYDKEILLVKSGKGTLENQGWKGIFGISSADKGLTADIWVNSFIKVNWGQGNSWNQFCPPDTSGPGGHTYVGCVAVAMAQAMSVFKNPATGYGTHSYLAPGYGLQFANFGSTIYKWDSMSLSLPDKYNSLLLYHCAVSVNMGFGADGSGTQVINASSALKNYFYYSLNVSYKKRLSDDKAWTDLLDQQLLNGRPIIYSGDADDGKPGHAFNIDGVVNSTYYHINWGWTGSNNGYYAINSLQPGINDFTKNHCAIIGIQPFYYPTDVVLSDTLVLKNRPEGNIVGVLKVIDEATDNVYTFRLASDSTFNGTIWSMDFYLKGDTVKTGRVFTASDNPTDTIIITVSDKFENTISKQIALKLGNSSTGIDKTFEQDENSLNIYPNPATDYIFFVQNKTMKIVKFRIYSVEGALVQINTIEEAPDGRIALNNLKPGLYILETELENHLLIRKKFIRK
jgi:hypothetical protein